MRSVRSRPARSRVLNSDQLDGLTTANVVALGTAQVAALQSTQVVSLNSDQLRAIETGDIKALSTTALRALDTDQLNSLKSTQLQSLTSSQVTALSTDQVQSLTTANLNAMTSDQLGRFSSGQVKGADHRTAQQPHHVQPERAGHRPVRGAVVGQSGCTDHCPGQQAGDGRSALHHHRRHGGPELRPGQGPVHR